MAKKSDYSRFIDFFFNSLKHIGYDFISLPDATSYDKAFKNCVVLESMRYEGCFQDLY